MNTVTDVVAGIPPLLRGDGMVRSLPLASTFSGDELRYYGPRVLSGSGIIRHLAEPKSYGLQRDPPSLPDWPPSPLSIRACRDVRTLDVLFKAVKPRVSSNCFELERCLGRWRGTATWHAVGQHASETKSCSSNGTDVSGETV